MKTPRTASLGRDAEAEGGETIERFDPNPIDERIDQARPDASGRAGQELRRNMGNIARESPSKA